MYVCAKEMCTTKRFPHKYDGLCAVQFICIKKQTDTNTHGRSQLKTGTALRSQTSVSMWPPQEAGPSVSNDDVRGPSVPLSLALYHSRSFVGAVCAKVGRSYGMMVWHRWRARGFHTYKTLTHDGWFITNVFWSHSKGVHSSCSLFAHAHARVPPFRHTQT